MSEENYDEAKQLKLRIDALTQFSEQIQMLEDRKQVAVAEDNFDEAKALKSQILDLTHRMMSESRHRPAPQTFEAVEQGVREDLDK